MEMPTFDRRAYRRAIGLFPERPRIVSEGDSWFSYPLSINLVRRLNLLEPRCNWLRLEHSGDEMLDLIADAALDDRSVTRRIGYQERRLAGLLGDRVTRPQALLLSAGGNDIIGDGMIEYLVPYGDFLRAGAAPEQALDEAAFARTLARIERAYRRIVHLRDTSEPRGHRGGPCWIVAHAYSAPQPRRVPLQLPGMRLGPWMHAAFRRRGYPDDAGRLGSALMLDVVRLMLERFAAMLRAVAADSADFHVAPTLGRLTPAPPGEPATQGDWHDEIHPSDAGNRRLADAFLPILAARFPGYFAG